MVLRQARYLAIIGMAALVLPGCEDDPLLAPNGQEPDSGGSYGRMILALEPSEADSVSADSVSGDSRRADGERSREQNPRLF